MVRLTRVTTFWVVLLSFAGQPAQHASTDEPATTSANPPGSASEVDAAPTPRPAAAFDIDRDESPPLPAPRWVRMIDQGSLDPALAGIQTPAGVRVEVVAQEPVIVNPVGMTFSDSGTPYVLEWRIASQSKLIDYQQTYQDGTIATIDRMWKNVGDELKTLSDGDGDGRYEQAMVRLNDLQIPSTLLLDDGWLYTASIGKVFRRPHLPPESGFGEPTEILHGLCGFNQHQASGLALSHDGWLFVSAGDNDNRAEGTDGSRATVLRCGAVFRVRPDGTQLSEYARGFRNPYRDVAFDSYYNMFHLDNDQEDGSKFQGVRLIHVQEGADYGWRLAAGNVCCRPDLARGAAFGERPGRMPAMLKTGRGASAGLMIYQGTAFPEFFRGLLIYPDVYRKRVRAYRVERDGSTFRVVEEFTLMASDDGLFRPCQAAPGPDGAIYIVDWRTDSSGAGNLWGDELHGRIYRLSWMGAADVPAIPRSAMDTWSRLRTAGEERLWSLLDSPDFELRRRAAAELVRRGERNRQRFIDVALAKGRSGPARASALGGACRFYNNDVQQAALRLLRDGNFELRRLAADALSRHATGDLHEPIRQLGVALADPHPAVRRAAALGFGQLVGQLKLTDEHRFRYSLRLASAAGSADPADPFLKDGFIRGVERIGKWGIDRLLQMAFSNDPARTEAAVAAFEHLRTADAVRGLDLMLQGDTDGFSDDQIRRLIVCYRNILVDPPISANAVANWLNEHPQSSLAARVAGLETLALVGGGETSQVQSLARALLNDQDAAARRAAVQAIGQCGLVELTPDLVKALRKSDRPLDERREVIAALARLRSRTAPFSGLKSPPGVELVLDELLSLPDDPGMSALRGELLGLIAQVDFAKAVPLAKTMLASEDPMAVAAAIDALGSDPQQAEEIGRLFAAGKLGRNLLPRVAAALQKHAAKAPDGPHAVLLAEVFKGGLLVSLDPAEVQRIETMVRQLGDPIRGRHIFFERQRGQCAHCHKLEGAGGQIGPDLSKIWQTHTVAKIIESMVEPSKEIKESFAAWTVTTTAGQVHVGLKVADTDQEVVLRDARGIDVRIPTAEVDEKSPSPRSLMPEGVVAQLSFQDFLDLVAFLKDQTAQEALRQHPTE